MQGKKKKKKTEKKNPQDHCLKEHVANRKKKRQIGRIAPEISKV